MISFIQLLQFTKLWSTVFSAYINVSAAARQLGLPMQTLASWQKKSEQGQLEGTVQYEPHLMSIIEKNKCLKRALKAACEERDILNEEG